MNICESSPLLLQSLAPIIKMHGLELLGIQYQSNGGALGSFSNTMVVSFDKSMLLTLTYLLYLGIRFNVILIQQLTTIGYNTREELRFQGLKQRAMNYLIGVRFAHF